MKFWHWFSRPHHFPPDLPDLPPDVFPDDGQEQERKEELTQAHQRGDEAERRIRALEQLRPIEFEQSLLRRKRARLPNVSDAER